MCVYGGGESLFVMRSIQKHKCILWAERRIFFRAKPFGTYSNHRTLDSYSLLATTRTARLQTQKNPIFLSPRVFAGVPYNYCIKNPYFRIQNEAVCLTKEGKQFSF